MELRAESNESDFINNPSELLSRLIRYDTTNPPGNEAQAVMFVKELLESAGLQTIIRAKDPNRPNLITRLPGKGQAPPLLLYGHMDVVTVKDQEWDTPPFEGLIRDGWVWGRGALDMKSGLAMMVSAILRIIRSGYQPSGDIILAVLSDEEKASIYGSKFLVEEFPDLFSSVKYAIGEFGGFPLYFGDKTFYAIQVAEKQACGIRAIFKGPPGHGAQPVRGGAMSKLGMFLSKLDGQPFPAKITPAPKMMIESICRELPLSQAHLLEQLLNPKRTDSTLALMGSQGRLFWPMLHDTASPTIVNGSDKINVIPARVTLDMDARLLPGSEPEDMIKRLRLISHPDTEFEVLRFEKCPHMANMELFPLLGEIVSELDPGAIAIPYLLSGITDARIFARLGIQTYGYLPMNLPRDYDFFSSVHGSNERIPVRSVEFGAKALHRLIERYTL
jgi:acetylornithine deacetylase/succinyl-diaminopimelate desuccinylase-like protein